MTPVQTALIRLLWRSYVDNAACTCTPDDQCPECDAMRALGLGRWDEGAPSRLMAVCGMISPPRKATRRRPRRSR